jgi:thiopurine S-methyltransferase
MDREFWIKKWNRQEIGFHQPQWNPILKQYWDQIMQVQSPESVFVPLCGKSLDLLFFRQKGLKVWGVELSSQAIEEFIQENEEVELENKTAGQFRIYHNEWLSLLCGDLFNLKSTYLPTKMIYDRASLIALPHQLRLKYAQLLNSLFTIGTEYFLICLEHTEGEKLNPPFSLSALEIQELFSTHWQIRQVANFPPKNGQAPGQQTLYHLIKTK